MRRYRGHDEPAGQQMDVSQGREPILHVSIW